MPVVPVPMVPIAVMPMAMVPAAMMPVMVPTHLGGHFRAVLHGGRRRWIAQRKRRRTFDRRSQHECCPDRGKPQDPHPVHSDFLPPDVAQMTHAHRALLTEQT